MRRKDGERLEAQIKKGAVQLLDCTLGVGGEPISGSYGEDTIYNMQSMFLRSGIELVEYGSLRVCTQGPNSAIYNSTKLPVGMKKQPGQKYVIVLEPDSRPQLKELPDHSKETVDLVRVFMTAEKLDEELEYSTGLMQKGYQIIALVDETAQYTEKQLSIMLKKINRLHPFACYLYDTSGVLNVDSLKQFFAVFERELSPEVGIGFHGRDNLQNVLELAQEFCQLCTAHPLYVDVSVGGMGAGALHLATEKFANWMNETYNTSYDSTVLQFLATYVENYVEPKGSIMAKLLYQAAAKQRCSYKYMEYYCKLKLKVADQMQIYPQIAKECTLKFKQDEANKALMTYRKEHLKMALVVITENQSELVESMLRRSAEDLLVCGVDLIIYDSSKNDRTHAATVNYQLDGYSHIFYKRYPGGPGGRLEEKIRAAYREHLDYDYIWLFRPDLVPTVSKIYQELLSFTEDGMEYIAIDGVCRNKYRYCTKKYDNCGEFFGDNSTRLSVIGTSILKSTFVRRMLDLQPLKQEDSGFWMPMAALRQLAEEKMVKAGLMVTNAFEYNGDAFRTSFFKENSLQLWGKNWYYAVMNLPEVYALTKTTAVRVQMPDMHPFHLESMMALRLRSEFNLRIYRQWKQRLAQISDTSKWKFYFIATCPKCMIRGLQHMRTYISKHPGSRTSRIANKMFDIYVRLGR